VSSLSLSNVLSVSFLEHLPLGVEGRDPGTERGVVHVLGRLSRVPLRNSIVDGINGLDESLIHLQDKYQKTV